MCWRGLLDVFATGWLPEGPRERFWDDFGSILDGVWSMFGVWIVEPGLGILKETSQVLLHVDEVALRN